MSDGQIVAGGQGVEKEDRYFLNGLSDFTMGMDFGLATDIAPASALACVLVGCLR